MARRRAVTVADLQRQPGYLAMASYSAGLRIARVRPRQMAAVILVGPYVSELRGQFLSSSVTGGVESTYQCRTDSLPRARLQ